MQSVRLMGDGYEPHVDRSGDRLTYSLPVDSGIVSFSFTFDICQADLDVLLADGYRRAALEVIAHTLLQHSALKGNDCFTQSDFDSLIIDALYSTFDSLQAFIGRVSREHNIVIDLYMKEVINRRSAAG